MDWYPWYPTLYAQDTMHLDPYQDGCYRRMIDHYMKTRAPLPDNDFALARICGDSHPNWVANGGAIAKAFFTPDKTGFLRHKRCDLILDDQDTRARSLSESGKKGAEKRWAKSSGTADLDSLPYSHPIATPMGYDSTRQDKTDTGSKKVSKSMSGMPDDGYANDFEDFWSGWIPHEMPKGDKQKSKQAYAKARKDVDHETIIRGRDGYLTECRKFNTKSKHAVTWLNQAGWANERTDTHTVGITKPSTSGGGALMDAASIALANIRNRRNAEAFESGGDFEQSSERGISYL